MSWLIRKLRDLDAWLTSYGQCVRCHRSWRYASPVMVGFGIGPRGYPGSSYFALCVGCYRHEVVKRDAGLVLQGWAALAMRRNQLPLGIGYSDRQRKIMAAYGMAPRFPLELDTGWSDGPDVYRVRVIDDRHRNRLGRADLSPTGGRVRPTPAKQSHDHDHPAADGADGRDGHAS